MKIFATICGYSCMIFAGNMLAHFDGKDAWGLLIAMGLLILCGHKILSLTK